MMRQAGPTRMRPNCVNNEIETAYFVKCAIRDQYRWYVKTVHLGITLSAEGECTTSDQAREELIWACDMVELMLMTEDTDSGNDQ